MAGPLKDRLFRMPTIFDVGAAERFQERAEPHLGGLDARSRAFLFAVASASPYLAKLMRERGEGLVTLFNEPTETRLARIIGEVREAPATDDDALRQRLRRLKADAALSLGLAEVAGALSSLEAAALLSNFADAACDRSLRQALCGLSSKGFSPRDSARAEASCGIAIIAMGKLGASELNYSSDIDLIAIFDPEAPVFEDGAAAREVAVAAVRRMIAFLNDQTPDGYVFRTDLRLRPDPGVSAAAISLNAAEAYYERHGQNWERAAFIRARAAAGDIELGEEFLKRLRPFIWRRHLDFAAIDDINSILMQIHTAKGSAEIAFAGHNIKTGRGGIREIEFLIQTRQLILGGKDVRLRGRSALAMIDALSAAGEFSEARAQQLKDAYASLRRVEHALQMIADEQTHSIPQDESGQGRVAALLGEDDSAALKARLVPLLRSVQDISAELFDADTELSTSIGPLSFTGVEADTDTIATLEALGFKTPSAVIDGIRRWHFGELRSTRTERARNLLTRMTPKLIEALAEADDPDEAFRAFDYFLRGLPAGVQIFSLFVHNPAIFDTLIRIITVSPYLGRQLVRRAELVEALTNLNWPLLPDSGPSLRGELTDAIEAADSYEDALNTARRWSAYKRFDVAAQLITGHLSVEQAAGHFSEIAEVSIRGLSATVRKETNVRTRPVEGAMVTLGLGRLGARRMTALSDVDLMFIYDAHPAPAADTPDPVTYITRLVRRYVSALAAPTEEGALYDVDMQLRPSGNAGPVAVSLDAFRRYYENDAWTWEFMALVKARVVAGDAALGQVVADEIHQILSRERNVDTLRKDVIDMRARLLSNRKAHSVFDIKTAHGGLTDIDFIAQYLFLCHRPVLPALTRADSLGLLAAMGQAEIIPSAACDGLLNAGELFEAVLQMSRATGGDGPVESHPVGARARRLAAAAGVRDLHELEAMLTDAYEIVRHHFGEFVGSLDDVGL